MPSLSRRQWLSLAGSAVAGAQALRRPNIIWIMADDMGWGDPGCYGQKLIQTPNIDRLAAQGMRFTSAYAGSAVCAPSRSCLMTGQHSGHTRVRWNHSVRTGERVPLLPEDTTVAKILKGAGYSTGITGKWGLGEPGTTGIPNRQGFDDWYGFLNQDHAVDFYTDHLWRNEKKETVEANQNGARGEYATDLFTSEALRFIRVNRWSPFFLYLSYTAPHVNLEVPSQGAYKDKPWSEGDKNYAAMITRMDYGIGQVMELLSRLRLATQTLVIFTSDNGAGHKSGLPLFHSTGSFRGAKGEVYEGGLRVPMIARWPGRIQAGTESDYPWAFWDFLPTAAELAGVTAPPGIDGVSVLPVLLGKPDQPKREYLYWEAHQKGFHQAVRAGNWKGVRHGLKGPLELYDLAADSVEEYDLAAKQSDVVARLTALLDSARTENADYPAQAVKKK
ncbi:MAG: arylsulfatase [Acidobacteria bacterium]|nr:arylsulfatase [Acidobacteriota bacterium]